MKIELMARVNGMRFSYEAGIEVSDVQRECFEPLKTNDEPWACVADGGVMAHSEAVNIVMKTREDAADIIAKELAKVIVSAMKKNDTHNGY